MRRLIKVFILALPLALAYAAWPVHSALEIREAIVAGDTATLNRKIDWEALRLSLKSSISPETLARLMEDPDAPKPSLWQRIKAVVAPSMAEGIIDRYVTPEHLPVLLGYRRIYRGTVQPGARPQGAADRPCRHLARRARASIASPASGPGCAAPYSIRPAASCSRSRTSTGPGGATSARWSSRAGSGSSRA